MDLFLDELEVMCRFEDDGGLVFEGNVSALYAKYPKVRLGLRRSLFFIQKRRNQQ